MDELVANLLKAYKVSIDSLEWMSPETRAAAQAKLAKFTVKIGYPDKWKDYSALDHRQHGSRRQPAALRAGSSTSATPPSSASRWTATSG